MKNEEEGKKQELEQHGNRGGAKGNEQGVHHLFICHWCTHIENAVIVFLCGTAYINERKKRKEKEGFVVSAGSLTMSLEG